MQTTLDWEPTIRRFEQLLRLTSFPVAFKMLENKDQLESKTARQITNHRELADLREHLKNRRQSFRLDRFRIEAELKSLQTEYNSLINTGVADPKLHAVREEGHGTLLSERYEDIPVEWAANLEGRLGPLANALVVKDLLEFTPLI